MSEYDELAEDLDAVIEKRDEALAKLAEAEKERDALAELLSDAIEATKRAEASLARREDK